MIPARVEDAQRRWRVRIDGVVFAPREP